MMELCLWIWKITAFTLSLGNKRENTVGKFVFHYVISIVYIWWYIYYLNLFWLLHSLKTEFIMFRWQIIFIFFFKGQFFLRNFDIPWVKKKGGDDSAVKEYLFFYKQQSKQTEYSEPSTSLFLLFLACLHFFIFLIFIPISKTTRFQC